MQSAKNENILGNLNILGIVSELEETADKTKTINPTIPISQVTATSVSSPPGLNSGSDPLHTNNGRPVAVSWNLSRDDVKMAVILNWPYLKLHKQTGEWFSERQYKRIWEVLGIYYEKRKREMSVTDRILLNRRLLCCAIRILKETLLDNEMESEEKLSGFLDRAIRVVFESYRYLNIYIMHILPMKQAAKAAANAPNSMNSQQQQQQSQTMLQSQNMPKLTTPFVLNVVDQNWSFLTSDDEYIAEIIPKPKIQTNGDINCMYTLPNYRDLKAKYSKTHEYVSLQKIEYMISLKNIDLNLHLELDKFFVNLIQLFTWSAFMYKKFMKFRNAYWFLKEAERIGESLKDNNNEDLLNSIARVQIALSNIYFEAGRTHLAIEKTENSILVLQCELRLRQTKWEFSKSKEAEDNILKCVKTLVTSLINLATYQENIFLYEEAYFSIQTADWFSVKYIKGLDEVKKFSSKVQQDFEKLYSDYLQTRGEIEVISKHVFWQELIHIYSNWEEKCKTIFFSILVKPTNLGKLRENYY